MSHPKVNIPGPTDPGNLKGTDFAMGVCYVLA